MLGDPGAQARRGRAWNRRSRGLVVGSAALPALAAFQSLAALPALATVPAVAAPPTAAAAPVVAAPPTATAAQAAAAAQSTDATADSVQITAHVRDLVSREALPGAVIQLSGVVGRHVTDLDGQASFNAAVGEYELVVRRSGYEPLQGDFRVLRSGDFFLRMVRAEVDDPSAPSRLLVTVADAETGRPIEGAAVSLLSGEVRPTNARGAAAFQNLAPVLARITVEMIGYAPRSEPVVLHPGRTTAVQVGMAVRAIELEPVVVEVRVPLLEAHGVYDRLARGLPRGVLTRDAIERQASHRVSDALLHVPGLEVRREGRSLGFPSRAVVYARGCPLSVWVDGIEFSPDVEGSVDIDQISPEWIELAEVYWGTSTPMRFSSRNDCGAVLIWTRHGRRR